MSCLLDQTPRDHRGYVIPYVVLRDENNRPHFTINDDTRRARVIALDLCPICSGKLWRGRWFVGGPGSAFHARGAYIDPPMHDECAHYALTTCPYLASPNYSKRIDAGTLKPSKGLQVLLDPTVDPTRLPLFVAIMTTGQTHNFKPNFFQDYLKPKRPYRRVEYWRHGRQLDEAEARPIVEQELARLSK
jgi:hypothetical protein